MSSLCEVSQLAFIGFDLILNRSLLELRKACRTFGVGCLPVLQSPRAASRATVYATKEQLLTFLRQPLCDGVLFAHYLMPPRAKSDLTWLAHMLWSSSGAINPALPFD